MPKVRAVYVQDLWFSMEWAVFLNYVYTFQGKFD